jgi:Membrane-bound toxin component of toxin-antitoxin system
MAALRLDLGASRALAAAMALVHGLAAACAVALVPGAGGLLLAALVLALGIAAARDRALVRGRGAVRALELGHDGAITLELRDGRRFGGRASGRRNVGRGWVILWLQGMPRRSVLVMRDMLAPAEFRRLRLWALWGKLPAAARAAHAG